MVFQVKTIQEHRLNPSSNSRVKNIVTPESQALELHGFTHVPELGE